MNSLSLDNKKQNILDQLSPRLQKIALKIEQKIRGILEKGKEINQNVLDFALKLIPATTRPKVLLFLTLSLGAMEMQSQQRDTQAPNTIKVMTVDNRLDDNQWNSIAVADREAGFCLQDHFTTTALNADTRLAGIFVRHTSQHLPDSELASTGNKGADLTNWYNYISSHSGFDINHWNFWYNHQNYGAKSENGPWNDWVFSIAGSSVEVKSIQGHEGYFAMANCSTTYDNANTNVPFHEDATPIGGPANFLRHGSTLGAATTSGTIAMPLYTTNPTYNVASAGNHPDTPQYDGFYHFKIPVNGVMLDAWVDPAELENANGNTNDNLAGFFANYPNFTQELATYYNPVTGNNEAFQPPAVPVVSVSNGVLTLTNASAYNNPQKISHTAVQSEAGVDGNYVLNEAKFYVYKDLDNDGTVDVTNNQYVFGPFTLTEMTNGVTLPEGTYRVLAHYYWSNSEVTPSLASAPITIDATPPVLDNPNLSDLTGQCEINLNSSQYPTATDAVDGTIVGAPNVTFPITTQGTTVITWTYTDSSGNSVQQTQNAIVADTEAPTIPANFAIDTTTDTSVSVHSDTSVDNCQMAYYEFYIDTNTDGVANGTLVDTATTPNYTYTNLNDNTTYEFYSKAVDATGNTSDASNVVQTTTLVGIEDQELAGLRFYPNPATNTLNIEIDGELDDIEIYNLQGQLIREFDPQGASKYPAKISGLAKDVYIVDIYNKQGQKSVAKLVVK